MEEIMKQCIGCKFRRFNPDIGYMCKRNDEEEDCYEKDLGIDIKEEDFKKDKPNPLFSK